MRELYNVTVGIMDGTSLERANERSARVEFSNMYYI
jgi:hypothetical protein